MFTNHRKHEPKCLICDKNLENGLNLRHFLLNDDLICCNCRNLLVLCKRIVVFKELKVRALYQYNDFYRKLIIQYKELGDEALADIIIYPFAKKLHTQYHGYTVCGVPSSWQKLEIRGFSHVEKMFRLLQLEYQEVFVKDDVLQKQQKYSQRTSIQQHIFLKESILIKSPILLVDDIMTTGQTLWTCYQLLKARGYQVTALVGAISSHFAK